MGTEATMSTQAVLCFLSAFLLLVGAAQGQCDPSWVRGEAVPGIVKNDGEPGSVSELALWDKDGTGPEPELVVAVGAFDIAGSRIVKGIAAWNPATGEWMSLNTTDFTQATAVVVRDNDNGGQDLIVGGYVSSVGGQSVYRVAKRTGEGWAALGGRL
jgi:hypothetical protein